MFSRVKSLISYSKLPTEQNNAASRNIDRVSISSALKIINKEDARVALAVRKKLPAIEKAVRMVLDSLRKGGRLFFIGAGTSGRLGILEAAECPPTFNTPPSLVRAFMAGGRSSVFRSKEGAEDRGAEAVRIVRRFVRPNDAVIGIAASGVTPFVRDGLVCARQKKAQTILITCHSGKMKSPAYHTIAIHTGPEVIAGSTRLKAATATKLVLNSITVATMVQLGKVYGNRMVDLQPRSEKLKARSIGLISSLGRVSTKKAKGLLSASGGNAKTAILMARKKISKAEAVRRLKKVDNRLYLSLRGRYP